MSKRSAEWSAKIPISDQKVRDASITSDEFVVSQLLALWLRSVGGERGKWNGGRRVAPSKSQPERNARRRAADGSPPHSRHSGECPLVTSARICGLERASSKGNWATGSPWSEATARWSRRAHSLELNDCASTIRLSISGAAPRCSLGFRGVLPRRSFRMVGPPPVMGIACNAVHTRMRDDCSTY